MFAVLWTVLIKKALVAERLKRFCECITAVFISNPFSSESDYFNISTYLTFFLGSRWSEVDFECTT